MAARRSATSRLLRFVGFGLLNLFVLVLVVALAAPFFFDPNDYKDSIARQVKAHTGRDVAITGDMRFSVLPWLGVSVGEMAVGNAEGFGDVPFAKLASAEVRVKLVPLLGREVQMDTVSVTGLELNLARDAAGRGNWADLAERKGSAPQGPASEGDGALAVAAFALGGVRLEDASVSYRDAATGLRLSLTDVDLRTGPVTAGEPVDAELSLRFAHPRAGGKASARARIAYDLATGRYAAEGLDLAGEITADALGPKPATATASGSVVFEETTRRVSAGGLTVTVQTPAPAQSGLVGDLALSASGDWDLRLDEGALSSPALRLRVDGLSAGDGGLSADVALDTALAASLAGPRVVLAGLRGEGRVQGGPLSAQPLSVKAAGDITVDFATDTLDAQDLRLEAANATAAGGFTVVRLSGAPRVTGTLTTPAFDLKAVLARAELALPTLADPEALTRVAVRTRFSADAAGLRLSDLELELDGARAAGGAQRAADGALGFDLAVDRLDVDRYLPAAAPGAPPPAAAGALPVETLRALDVDGRLRADTLRYAGLELAAVDVGVKAKDGLVRLDPLKARLFGGSYAGDVRIDARGETPLMRLDERVTQVDAAALLAALGVSSAPLDLSGGRSDLSLKATVATDASGQRVRASGVDLDARLGGRSFRDAPLAVAVNGDVAVDLAASNATLEGITARVAGLTLSTQMQVGFAPGALTYRGRVAIPTFDARALAGRFDVPLPPTSDRRAFTALGVSAAIEGTESAFKASSLALELDGSRVSGELAVRDFAHPAVAFDIDVDRLDADRYLPPAARGKAATPGAAVTALPVDLVRSLNVDGTLDIGALTVAGVRMRDVKLTAVAKDGRLALSPLAAGLYGGRYDGNVVVDAREPTPRLTMDETVQGIRLGDLLRDLTGDVPVTGTADVRAVLAARGADSEALKRTVDGEVRFTVRDGALQKMDMVHTMCTALAALDFDNLNRETVAAGVVGLLLDTQRPSTTTSPGTGARTEFTDLSGSARITQGIARNDDLVMVSPVVRVRGAGAVNLPLEQVDYRAEAELVQSCAGIGRRDLAGHVIPVNIRGPIAKPEVQPEIPAGLIRALRERRTTAQPAPTSPPPAAPQEPPPTKPDHVIKDTRDDLLRGILQGIIKQQ
jgi:AsmA protein